MAVSTVTLPEFLSARIAEDERDADCILFDHGQGNIESREARMLAECEAKRQIVESCAQESLDNSFADPSAYRIADDVLRALALPYADHDDYREEWKP